MFDEMTDEMYVCECVCACMFRQIFVLLGFSASKDGSVLIFFVLTSANLFQRFSLLLSRFNISVFFGTW